MYRYKLVNNDDFKIAYKRHLRKNLLVGTVVIISVVTLIIFTILFFVLKIIYESAMIIFICIASILLIIESFIFNISYKKEIKKILNSVTNSETDISFDEKGISLYEDGIVSHISWNGVKEVSVDGDNLLIIFKVTGLPANFFYLKFFDIQRDELIKDIEKYIKVKRC